VFFACQMFSQDRATLHVDLDEAELASLDGDVRPAGIAD